MLLNVIRLIFIFAVSFNVNAQGSLQNPDFKTVEQLQAQGLTEEQAKAQMLHDTKVYVTTGGLNKLLSEAIADGDIGGSGTDVLTTDGDLLFYDSEPKRLPIGDQGQILTVSPYGFPTWINPPDTSPTTTRGDLIIRGTIEDERLPIGAAGKVLTSNGTTATWENTGESLPDQEGKAGEFLISDGISASWDNVNRSTNTIKNNLFLCVTSENCNPENEWVTTTPGIISSGVVSRDEEQAAYNYSAYDISSASITNYIIRSRATKIQNFEGQQMLGFCEVKTLRPNTFFIVGANATEQSRRQVISDGKWRYYEIPFIGGDTSQFIELNGDTTASVESIFIDNCFMGKVSPDYFARVSGAQYVGSLAWQPTVNCMWDRTSTTIGDFNSDSDCDDKTRILDGSLSDSSSGLLPQFTLNSARTDGVYRVLTTGSFYKNNLSANQCYFYLNFQDGTTSGGAVFNNGQPGMVPVLSSTFRFQSNGSKVVKIQNNSNVASLCSVDSRNVGLKFSVEFIPDLSNTIVTQNTELTAQSANEFVATVSNTGVVSGENFDWINGNCTHTGTFSCNLNAGIFNTAPNCVATALNELGATAIRISATTSTLSGLTFDNNTTGGTLPSTAKGFSLNCTRSTDYRKHATIVGKFENINSSELVNLRYSAGTTEAINNTAPVIKYSNQVEDKSGSYNTSNGYFTAPRSSYYFVNAAFLTTSSSYSIGDAIEIRVRNITSSSDLARGIARVSYTGTTSHGAQVSKLVYLNESEQLAITGFSTVNNTIQANIVYSFLDIQELPDTESIIKNLNDDDSKVVSDTTGNRVKVLNGLFSNATASVIACSSGTCASTGNNTGGAVATFVSLGKYQLDFPAGTWKPLTLVSCSYTCHQTSTQIVILDALLNTISQPNGSFTPNTIGCITAASTPTRTNSAVSWQCIGEKP